MAIFQPIIITNAGLNLLSQAVAGQGTLTFTSIVTSSTAIAYNPTTIQGMTSLSGIVQTAVPSRALLQDGTAQVSAVFDNSGLSQGYTANTLGLYATLGSGTQTLFAVAVASTPDNIPAPSGLPASSFYYQFNISISDTSQLTIGIPEGGSLPSSVFNQMFPGIVAPDQDNDGDALVYNAASGAWGYVNTETVFTTVSGSGEFVSLQKTLADDFKQIQLFGKSVQAETTGVQLFDINTAKNYDEAEITDYSSGTMEIEQSNSAMLQSPKLKEWCPTMQAGQSYLLICETTSTKKYITIGSSQWNFGGIFIPTADDLEENVEWHCTTQRSTSGVIVYYRDTFAGIMIVEGSTEKPYEVYTGGEAATEPTPEFPLPITSAGNYDAESEKYEVGIGVTGKNLFDASKVPTKTQGGATVTNNGDGSFTISGSGNVSGAYYQNIYDYTHEDTLKMLRVGEISVKDDSNTNPYFIAQLKTDKTTNIYSTLLQITKGQTKQITKEMLENPNVFLRVQFFGENGSIIIPGTIKPLLYQEGDSTWEPFKQQLSTLQLPNPLRGIPVDSGGNYTDADGQQWICDYIDRERGKYVQNVGVYESKGNENWNISDIQGVGGSIRYDCEVSAKIPNKNFCVNNYFKNVLPNTPDGTWVLGGLGLQLRIIINKTVFEDVDALKTFLQTAYSSGNPVTWYYQLATPTEESLTPDQLAALNLSTYQGITNIGTDTMPQVGMSIESRGFNLAGDLAQNLIDLQTTVQTQTKEIEALQSTVQSQGSAIAENTEKLNTLGLVGYGRKAASQSGESVSLISLISEGASIFKSGAIYSVYFDVTFSDYGGGDATFQPYIQSSISDRQIHITKIDLPPVYQASSVSMIPYSCTFMIPIDEDEKVTGLSFYVDENSHNFKDMTVAVYRVK